MRRELDSHIGKFQDAKMRTTPSGSGSSSPLAGNKSNGNSPCQKMIQIHKDYKSHRTKL